MSSTKTSNNKAPSSFQAKCFLLPMRLLLFMLLHPLGVMAQGEFITTWKTDNTGTSANNQITIPTGTGTFSYTVDWGDGTPDTTVYTGSTTHTYTVAGTYTVAITGDFPHIFFNDNGDKQKILSIEQWGTQQWTSMDESFYGCSNLVGNAPDVPDLSVVTNMSGMFLDSMELLVAGM